MEARIVQGAEFALRSIDDMHLFPVPCPPQVKLVSWYDNEYGYSCRMCDLLQYIAAVDKQAK